MRWKPFVSTWIRKRRMNSSVASVIVLWGGGAFDPIVLVLEGDAVLVGGHEPAIGDRNAVGVARQIAQHLPGPSERLLGVDHPIDLAQWRQIGLECSLVGEPRMIAEELQAAGVVGRDQHLQKQPAEQRRENLHGYKIAWSARDPLRSV